MHGRGRIVEDEADIWRKPRKGKLRSLAASWLTMVDCVMVS